MPANAVADAPPQAPLTEPEILIAARALGTAGVGGARLVATLLDPRLQGQELARRIGSEPGVAARVLRVANSAFFGCSGSVCTLDRAVQVLGLQGIKGAAAAACMDRMVGSQAAGAGFDASAFRRHSLATACLAARLARALDTGLDEEAFMAGLLHDLGMVVQWRLRPRGMQALRLALASGQVPQDSLAVAEQHHVGVTHERCTAIVLQAWHLPASLVQAVEQHEHAPLADRPDLASVLHCADGLAASLELGTGVETRDRRPWREALARWGIDDAALAALQQAGRDEALSLMAALQG